MRAAAAASSALVGLGFGIPCLLGMIHLARTGEVWTFLGFPTYGGGPFERIGVPTTVPLLGGYLAVCVAELVVAALILLDSPAATALSWALLPLEAVFWIGFALPFGPPFGIARVVLLALA
ncbi:MAG TPA: hypothetical protein VNS55_12200 [Nocardioides sp.]|nr:hypothetical protein [Nocardioides sp.]